MRKHLINFFARICNQYRDEKKLFWIRITVLQMLCFLTPLIEKISTLWVPNQYLTEKILQMMTLRPALQALMDPLFKLMLIMGTIIICLIGKDVIKGNKPIGMIYELMPGYLPVLIWLNCEIVFGSTENLAGTKEICSILIIFFIILWAIYVIFLQPMCLEPHRCINKPRQIACIAVFLVTCLLKPIQKFESLIVMLSMHCGMFFWHLLTIGFVSQEIQKVRIAGWGVGIVTLFIEVVNFQGETDSGSTILALTFVIIVGYVISFWQMLMDFRNHLLFSEKQSKNIEINHVIVAIYFILESKDDRTYEHRHPKRLLNSLAMQIGNQTSSIVYFIENQLKITKKSQYGQLLVAFHMKNLNFVKAILSSTIVHSLKAGKKDKFSHEVRFKANTLIIRQYERWMDRFQDKQEPWQCPTINHRKPPTDVQTVFQMEKILRQLAHRVQNCIYLNSQLLKGLIANYECRQQGILDQLHELHNEKNQIEAAFKESNSLLISFDGLFVFYFFLNLCRGQKFSLMDELGRHFEQASEQKLSSTQPASRHLICLVSGQDQFIGVVLNANKLMRQTFKFSPDRIQHKALNISQIMPKHIAVIHDDIIRNFKANGKMKFIGRSRNLLAIGKDKIIRLEGFVKLCASNQGLIFAASLILPKNVGQYALYDSSGQITECSGWVQDYFEWDTKPNILKIVQPVGIPNTSMRFSADFPGRSKFAIIEKPHYCQVELYDQNIATTYLGVCKFLMLTNNKNYHDFATRQLKGPESDQTSKSLGSEVRREDKRFHDLEFQLKARNIPVPWAKLLQFLVLTIFTLTVAALIFLGYLSDQSYNQIQAVVTVNQYLSKAQTIKNLQILMDCTLEYGIYNDILTEDLLVKYNVPVFSQYLKKQLSLITAYYIKVCNNILPLTLAIDPIMAAVLVKKIVDENSVVKKLKISYFSTFTLKLSMVSEYASYDNQTFLNQWSDNIYPGLRFIRKMLSIESENDKFNKQLKTVSQIITKFNDDMKANAMSFLTVLLCLFLLYLFCLSRKLQYGRRFLRILNYIDDSFIQTKLQKNIYIMDILKVLAKTPVDDLKFDIQNHYVMASVGNENFVFESGRVLPSQTIRLLKLNTTGKQKRMIKETHFLLKQPLGWIPVVLFIGLAIFFFCLQITERSGFEQPLNTYFKIEDSLINTQLTFASFKNIILMRFINKQKNLSFMSLPADDFFEKMKGNIYTRTYESLILQDPKWKSVVDTMYKPMCDPNTYLCRNLLKGALLGGWQSAVSQFTSTLVQVYRVVRDLTLNSSSTFQNETLRKPIAQIYLSYTEYIRSYINKFRQTNQEILQSYLHDENLRRAQTNSFILPLFSVLLLITLFWTYKAQKKMQATINQILTLDTVDFLFRNMHFSFQFSQL